MLVACAGGWGAQGGLNKWLNERVFMHGTDARGASRNCNNVYCA